jgi:uncharacterized protein
VPDIRNDRKAWLDQWVRGVNGGFGNLRQARSSVSVLFEMHKETQVDEATQTEKEVLVPNGCKDAKTFPLPDTTWTGWYLHGDGSLTTAAPTAEESPQPYVTGTKRQFWSYQAGGDVGPPLTTAAGPDELSYRSEPVATDTAIAGPITATLFVQSTAPGHRAVRRSRRRRSRREPHVSAARGAARESSRLGRLAERPHARRSHLPSAPAAHEPDQHRARPDLGVPGGGVAGRTRVPGRAPRLGQGARAAAVVDCFYAYVPRSAPGVNTVLQGPDAPSRIMLPMVPLTGVPLGPPLPCGAQEAVRCVAQPG